MVSPLDSASTPKAAAPSAEIPPHTSSTPIRFMGPKLRRALPMFNFEHRFEILTTQASWVLASRGASAVGAPATETRPDPVRLAETVQGRVAIVTGGATGLGRATAIEFAQRGTAVAINYVELPERDVGAQALLTETAIRALGVPVYCARCDVRNHAEVAKFVGTVRERLCGVHYLVNNAGVAHDGALWRLEPDAWQEVLDTNVTGAFNCIQAVAQPMRAQQGRTDRAHQVGGRRLGPLQCQRQRGRPRVRQDRAALQAAAGSARAGRARVGTGAGGGAGGRGAGHRVSVQRGGAPHHRAGDRGGRWVDARFLKNPGAVTILAP